MKLAMGLCMLAAVLGTTQVLAQTAASPPTRDAGTGSTTSWATAWVASVQGPYPVGNPSAQPDQRFAFPDPAAGARDQSFRIVLRPDLWGPGARLRFSNALGTRPLTVDGAFLGLQLGGGTLVPGSNQPVRFNGQEAVTIAPGASAWSDPVPLPFATGAAIPMLAGRKLAASFHVVGESGPMTWHAKGLQTSYVSPPGSGSLGGRDDEAAFPFPTASRFFLDALDMQAPAGTPVVVAFGDSITDGTASTMNGDDRWPDVLARRLHARQPNAVAVVDAGIGGNQVVGPDEYTPAKPFAGGPSALSRLERDVLSLSGVRAVIWLEGINDLSGNGGRDAAAVEAGMREGVRRLRGRIPGIRVIGATVTTALGSTGAGHGSAEQDGQRRRLNSFIRDGGVFDAVADFDAATLDPATGGLKPEMVPESTTGGPGDKLHPNRVGYLAMGQAIDLATLLPAAVP